MMPGGKPRAPNDAIKAWCQDGWPRWEKMALRHYNRPRGRWATSSRRCTNGNRIRHRADPLRKAYRPDEGVRPASAAWRWPMSFDAGNQLEELSSNPG